MQFLLLDIWNMESDDVFRMTVPPGVDKPNEHEHVVSRRHGFYERSMIF